MQPNDLMDLMFFDDVQVVRDTGWKTYKQRADLGNALNEFKSTSRRTAAIARSSARSRR